jgi:hypothetical protein
MACIAFEEMTTSIGLEKCDKCPARKKCDETLHSEHLNCHKLLMTHIKDSAKNYLLKKG